MEHNPVPEGYRPVKEALPIALTRAREALLSHWRPFIAARGFTEQQWRVLRVVNEYEPIDISTLASFSALHMPSVTRILQALQQRGFVTRERDKLDSRRSWIRSTKKAREVMYTEGARTQEINDQIIARFGEENYRQLSRLLNELAELRVGTD